MLSLNCCCSQLFGIKCLMKSIMRWMIKEVWWQLGKPVALCWSKVGNLFCFFLKFCSISYFIFSLAKICCANNMKFSCNICCYCCYCYCCCHGCLLYKQYFATDVFLRFHTLVKNLYACANNAMQHNELDDRSTTSQEQAHHVAKPDKSSVMSISHMPSYSYSSLWLFVCSVIKKNQFEKMDASTCCKAVKTSIQCQHCFFPCFFFFNFVRLNDCFEMEIKSPKNGRAG